MIFILCGNVLLTRIKFSDNHEIAVPVYNSNNKVLAKSSS